MNYKILVSAILSAIFFCFSSLYSAEPLVKFYLQDGSTKQYNLSEIDSLGVIDKKNNYVMRIHYDDTLIAYYPTEIIGSINFEKDSLKRKMLNVYIFNYPKSYELFYIDSLIFYIDQWQPLTIGSQVWMLKNLNVDHYRNGDSIPNMKSDSDWVSCANPRVGALCLYQNSDSLGKIYGKLYNWYAVGDARELAPSGWHVPTDAEWKTLSNYLGSYYIAGGKMKETRTIHWYKPNSGATNSSGFSALPGGLRGYDNGWYLLYELSGIFWTSTDTSYTNAWYMGLASDDINLGRWDKDKRSGFSVRCVKDGK